MKQDHLARDAAVACSLANLCFLSAWRSFLSPESYYYCYFCTAFAGWTVLAALLADVVLLALALFAAIRLVRATKSARFVAVAEVALLALVLVPLNAVREQIGFLSVQRLLQSLGRIGLGVLAVVALGLMAWVILAKRKQAARGILALLLILSPFGLVAIVQGVWTVRSIEQDFAAKQAVRAPDRSETGPHPRVVWIVFDEMDYEVAFENRPEGLLLPELDRLRRESLFATNAFPPAGFTELAIPSLLTGAPVVSTEIVGPSDIRIRFAERSDSVALSGTPTIFTQARKRGFSAAAVGWLHPYCRLFAQDLSACYFDTKDPRGPQKADMLDAMSKHSHTAASAIPVLGSIGGGRADSIDGARGNPNAPKVPRNWMELSRTLHEHITSEARRFAVDRKLDLVFLHLSVPHPPSFYDRSAGAFDVYGKGGYLDSLALADRTLGELRGAMEEAGVWNDTHVLVTSDHFWRGNLWMGAGVRGPGDLELWARRKEDFRVPFYLKLAGPAGATAYDASFNTVMSYDLTAALMDGGIGGYPDLARWLDEHKTFGQVEYNAPNRPPLSPPIRRPGAERK